MTRQAQELLRITLAPRIRMLPILQAATREIGDQLGLDGERILKITLAVEEVFGYCLRMGRKEQQPSSVTVAYRQEQACLQVVIEHQGPQGLLERHFLPGREGSFSLTTFDAIGLKIAHDILDNLSYVRLYDGTGRYTISVDLPPAAPAGSP